jgi:hypothetical protein
MVLTALRGFMGPLAPRELLEIEDHLVCRDQLVLKGPEGFRVSKEKGEVSNGTLLYFVM